MTDETYAKWCDYVRQFVDSNHPFEGNASRPMRTGESLAVGEEILRMQPCVVGAKSNNRSTMQSTLQTLKLS